MNFQFDRLSFTPYRDFQEVKTSYFLFLSIIIKADISMFLFFQFTTSAVYNTPVDFSCTCNSSDCVPIAAPDGPLDYEVDSGQYCAVVPYLNLYMLRIYQCRHEIRSNKSIKLFQCRAFPGF